MRHIASTDASVARAEAAAMVSGWFRTSTPGLSGDSSSSPTSATQSGAGRASKQTGTSTAAVLEVGGQRLTGEEKLLADDRCGISQLPFHCPAFARHLQAVTLHVHQMPRYPPRVKLASHLSSGLAKQRPTWIVFATINWRRCRAFLEWAEGSSGASRIAMELKALRSAAAARKVADLAGTAEGKEGLVRGLAEALKHDPSLRLQLGALLQ